MSIDAVTIVIKKALGATIADADALHAKTYQLERELNRIDCFWCPPGGKVRPGIPGFMACISDRYAEKAALERDLE